MFEKYVLFSCGIAKINFDFVYDISNGDVCERNMLGTKSLQHGMIAKLFYLLKIILKKVINV